VVHLQPQDPVFALNHPDHAKSTKLIVKMLLPLITLLLAATTISARPWTTATAVGPREDLPWQIYNLSLRALPANTTHANATQYIAFNAVGQNQGLTFNTTCNMTIPVGQSLFQDKYTSCAFVSAGFSLRGDGKLWFQRRYANGYVALPESILIPFELIRDSQPWPNDATTCSGFVDLTKEADYYSDGPGGVIAADSHLEIACTFQNGRMRK
jgi:hypothetical protein